MPDVSLLLHNPMVRYGTLLTLALAAPPALWQRSWRVFGRALWVAFFGVLVPATVFFLSAGFAPEWKGAAQYGWVDSFHEGKNALWPLVLWATASLYVHELSDPSRRDRPWVATGILTGAVVSLVCLAHGLATIPMGHSAWGFSVPGYVVLWYSVRAVQLAQDGAIRPLTWLYSSLISSPFWVGSVVLSRHYFRELPDTPPQCFVVSAAAGGHGALVGPRFRARHHGEVMTVNAQLANFWRLEDLWQRRSPRTHRAFRRLYNVWGYRAARLVRGPLIADAVYCALKPIELVACCVLAASADSRR